MWSFLICKNSRCGQCKYKVHCQTRHNFQNVQTTLVWLVSETRCVTLRGDLWTVEITSVWRWWVKTMSEEQVHAAVRTMYSLELEILIKCCQKASQSNYDVRILMELFFYVIIIMEIYNDDKKLNCPNTKWGTKTVHWLCEILENRMKNTVNASGVPDRAVFSAPIWFQW